MGKRKARHQHRRAGIAAAVSGASSREWNKALQVPPLPAQRSAMPPCKLPMTERFLHFRAYPCSHQGFLEGTTYGESNVY